MMQLIAAAANRHDFPEAVTPIANHKNVFGAVSTF
jgi:hypothetical protein